MNYHACSIYLELIGCSEMMEVSTGGDDFMPFSSQTFAMMYLLAHSPRPMVLAICFIGAKILYTCFMHCRENPI